MITTILPLNASTQPSLISHKSNQIQGLIIAFIIIINFTNTVTFRNL